MAEIHHGLPEYLSWHLLVAALDVFHCIGVPELQRHLQPSPLNRACRPFMCVGNVDWGCRCRQSGGVSTHHSLGHVYFQVARASHDGFSQPPEAVTSWFMEGP